MKKALLTTTAVIFDLDGVISNTQPVHALLESQILQEHGISMDPAEISRRFAGVSGRDMWPTIFREAGRECPQHEMLSDLAFERLCRIPDSEILAIPGTLEVIRGLAGRRKPLAVASGSRPAFIDRVVTALRVKDHFRALVSSKEVPRGKPAPDVFLKAAQKLEVPPELCVVIEDGVSGMEGARAAGMRCIALVQDLSCEYPADIVVTDLRDVPETFFN